jgi:uncharacterized phiE125 gp8 family phage protein
VLKVITPPVGFAVTVADLKAWAKLPEDDSEDTVYDAIVKAACEWTEKFLRRPLLTQTLELALDRFPGERVIRLPRPPVQSIVSAQYRSTADGAYLTLPADLYETVIDGDRLASLLLKPNRNWPATERFHAAVKVRFVAGWASAALIPEAIRRAILIVAHGMTVRRTCFDAFLAQEVKPLLAPWTVRGVWS